MRVARIEIFGFKSFMEKIVLPLEGGVTGVVGPNGCGKSNVVDALRWVLGETKAANLRGGVLEDVIFNGTDKLRPLGLAEVTVTLRASEENFFADLVSPALEAQLVADVAALEVFDEDESPAMEEVITAESEPLPEEAVVESDNKSERGRPDLTVISGGLDTAVAVEPATEPASEGAQDVSSASETPEQAGPAAAATFLTRFAWLKSVNEVQITRRLYRSGESEFFINRVPCRLKDLKDFFRAVGLGARSHTIVAQGEVSRIVTAKPEERRLILEDAAGVLGFRDKIASATRRLEETGVNISRLDDILKEVERQVGSLKRQAARAEARQEIKSRIAELEHALFLDKTVELREQELAVAQSRESAAHKEAEAETTLKLAQAHEQEARSELMSTDVESDALRVKMDAISEEIFQRERQRSDRRSRIAEVNAFVLARGTEMRRLEERKTTLQQRKTSVIAEIANLEAREASLTAEIGSFEQHGEEDLHAASERVQERREALQLRERELRAVREELIAVQSSLKAAREQLIAASPVTQLGETLAQKNSTFLQRISKEASLFVDGLRVPSQYSKAVQAVLAERAQFLVSDNPHTVAEAFVEEAYGPHAPKRRLGLGVFKQGEAKASNEVPPQLPFPRLLDVIEVQASVSLAAQNVFHHVFIAPSLAEAAAFFATRPEASESEAVIVTAEGDIVTSYSFYSMRHEGGIIQLKNKVAELEQKSADLSAQQQQQQTLRDEAHTELQSAETAQAEALRVSRERQARIRDLINQRGTVIGRLQSERHTSQQLEQDLLKAQQQSRDCELKIEEHKTEEARLVEELKTLVPDAEQGLRQELEALQKQYAEHDRVRKGGREKLANLALRAQESRELLDRARSEVSSLTLAQQKLVLEKQNLEERVAGEHGTEAFAKLLEESTSAARLESAVRSEFHDECGKLKARIMREGDVDPTSIERYREERERFESLSTQKQDLDQAATTLKRTIERLTQTSEQRFMSTFNAVKRNFSLLIPRLFGGGRGSLELLDPTKPLESGVEIIARPPGKKLKSIELMSGGEKCLCATALILGMFMEKPSPLCVLDEVDAPLDEANLVRFLTLIKEMSKQTQFLVITHNKNTMTTADNLVGVTMQEPGASKIISVSLQEAFSQVA